MTHRVYCHNSEGPFYGKARYHPAFTLHYTINYKPLRLNSGRLGETLVHLSCSLLPVTIMGPQHREATILDSLTGGIFELAPIVYLKSREDDGLQRDSRAKVRSADAEESRPPKALSCADT